MCTFNRYVNQCYNCPPSLDFPANPCHTNSMNKEQQRASELTLIDLATKKYHEQLQREYNYRQAIRDGSIERCESTEWSIADNH